MGPALAQLNMAPMRIGNRGADARRRRSVRVPAAEAQRFERAAMELQEVALSRALQSVQRPVEEVATLRAWYDRESAQQGFRAFFRNSEAVLAAYVGGATDEGYSTMLSKSYALTGRLRRRRAAREAESPAVARHVSAARHRAVRGRLEADADASGWCTRRRGCCSRRRMNGRRMPGACRSARRTYRSAGPREGIMSVLGYAAHVVGVPDGLRFQNRRKDSGCSGSPLPASRRRTSMR